MAKISDRELHDLLIESPELGWKRFVDTFTPTILRFIEQAGVVQRDEALDVYVRVCERLADDDAKRLRRRDPTGGTLSSWLVVVVRHAVVDWVRSRAGRRRLFRTVKGLDRVDRRVFELYYWEGLTPGEIVETLSATLERRFTLVDVLSALDRVQERLSQRQRSELLSLAARSQRPVSLSEEPGPALESHALDDPAAQMRARELAAKLNAALARLDPEEAAILRLKYIEGMSLPGIQRVLHLANLDRSRVGRIVARLKAALSESGTTAAGSAIEQLALVEEESR